MKKIFLGALSGIATSFSAIAVVACNDKTTQADVDAQLAKITAKDIELTAKVTANGLTSALLGITETSGYTYTYTHAAIDADGVVAVGVKITKDDLTSSKEVAFTVKKLDASLAILSQLNTELTKISAKDIELTAKVAANALTKEQLGITETAGYTYTYTHAAIDKNGDVEVTIKITKDGFEVTKKVTFTITKLTEALDVEAVQAELAKVVAKDIELTAKVAANALTKEQLGITETAGYTYTYTHAEIDANGDVAVVVKIAKSGQEKQKTVTFTVKKLTEALDAKAVQAELDKVADTKTITINSNVVANALTKGQLGITETAGFTYAYTHAAISASADVNVTVKITKGGQTLEKVIVVTVTKS